MRICVCCDCERNYGSAAGPSSDCGLANKIKGQKMVQRNEKARIRSNRRGRWEQRSDNGGGHPDRGGGSWEHRRERCGRNGGDSKSGLGHNECCRCRGDKRTCRGHQCLCRATNY